MKETVLLLFPAKSGELHYSSLQNMKIEFSNILRKKHSPPYTGCFWLNTLSMVSFFFLRSTLSFDEAVIKGQLFGVFFHTFMVQEIWTTICNHRNVIFSSVNSPERLCFIENYNYFNLLDCPERTSAIKTKIKSISLLSI